MIVGKASFSPENIVANVKVATEAIRKVKPASSKGIYIKSATMTSTMGPAIRFDANAV